ncbi:MAG: UDP-2,3-diacylglucosamine diphosphatase [Barnesiella sp.]|nr:UDP-2,3-diacylglucosamine diphosphatase [Barnesiella sp.]
MKAERTMTYFISDLHIGASYIPDSHAHQRMIADWLRSIAPTAKTLYLLGDILDFWYEYRTVVPRGYTRFFGALADLADRGVEIIWFKGNHDIWIFDYLPKEIGLKVVDGLLDKTIDGHRFVMEHGDGVGEPRRSYRLLRALFRNRFAQWLYAGIHPRWTVGFAHGWSHHSRKHGQQSTSTQLNDSDPLVRFALDYMDRNGHVDFFIFGHRHIMTEQTIASNTKLILLGDGFNHFSYGVWDGSKFSLKSFKSD